MIYILEDDESIRKLVTYALESQALPSRGFACPSEFWAARGEALPERLRRALPAPRRPDGTARRSSAAAGRARGRPPRRTRTKKFCPGKSSKSGIPHLFISSPNGPPKRAVPVCRKTPGLVRGRSPLCSIRL